MNKRRKVLAISSGGGHWVQLLRLRPAFEGQLVSFASVGADRAAEVAPHPYFTIPDANRATKLSLARLTFRLLWLLIRIRPDVVVTTGAACGYLTTRLAKWLGARTLFIDSIANADRLSLSAKLALRHADLTLTQWPELAQGQGPQFRGTIL